MVRLIKGLVQGFQVAQFPRALAVYFPWNAAKGQSKFFRPCALATVEYPATYLIAHTFTGTVPLINIIVWPRINLVLGTMTPITPTIPLEMMCIMAALAHWSKDLDT